MDVKLVAFGSQADDVLRGFLGKCVVDGRDGEFCVMEVTRGEFLGFGKGLMEILTEF